jgi:hypothetical protein
VNFDDYSGWDLAEGPKTPRWAKLTATLIVLGGVVVAVLIFLGSGDTKTSTVVVHTPAAAPVAKAPVQHETLPPASPPIRRPAAAGAAVLPPNAAASFEALVSSMSARVGLALQPLGGGPVTEFGELREGHAWSSIKVPIVVTLMREEQAESLSGEEASQATSAITASDNEAAAGLFSRLEELRGGITGASTAVDEVLRQAGDLSTTVATAPPPPGAVSSYGQTEWSLGGAVRFFGALARGCLLGAGGTQYVTGLMEDVIPEQRWGLGEGGFPTGWSVAMKGGWGPEGSASGPYLVRQSGIVSEGGSGIAVAMIAEDDSGSYSAGAADLTRIAQWLAGELRGLGPPSTTSCED